MGFFEKTFRFAETEYKTTQKALLEIAKFEFHPPTPTRGYWQEQCSFEVGKDQIISAGTFSMPSVEQLRSRVQQQVAQFLEQTKKASIPQSKITVLNIVGESRSLHSQPFDGLLGRTPSKNFPPENHYVFQAASQFNLLEFPGPVFTPEDGIEGYIDDDTQGPACAIACTAGTAYRNYLVPMEMKDESKPETMHQRGQTEDHQLNGLQLAEDYLKSSTTLQRVPWIVSNGYMESRKADISELNALLESDPTLHDTLVSKLQIGIQEDATVTDCDPLLLDQNNFQVTQTYNSAISIGYSFLSDHLWEPMAKIVLQATYEATLLAAMSKAIPLASKEKTGTVLLTQVGGGVFRNKHEWIINAIGKAIYQVEKLVTEPCGIGLDIRIVHFGEVSDMYEMLERE